MNKKICLCCKKDISKLPIYHKKIGRTFCNPTCRNRWTAMHRKNEWNWKEKSIGTYSAIHKWIKRRKPKPEFCEDCGHSKTLELANLSDKYLQIISDWIWLCRKCHMIRDGRINKLKILGSKDKNGLNNPNYRHGKYVKKTEAYFRPFSVNDAKK